MQYNNCFQYNVAFLRNNALSFCFRFQDFQYSYSPKINNKIDAFSTLSCKDCVDKFLRDQQQDIFQQ